MNNFLTSNKKPSVRPRTKCIGVGPSTCLVDCLAKRYTAAKLQNLSPTVLAPPDAFASALTGSCIQTH